MAHIFIAYCHKDSDFGYLTRQELESAGFQVWIDENIQGGDIWRQEIDDAIQAAFALVVIMSPDARLSEYVTYEWSCGWGAGKPIVPIMRKETKLHPRLEEFQYLNFTSDDRKHWPWNNLINRLKEKETQSTSCIPYGAPTAVKQAVAALNSHKVQERKEALETLSNIKHPSAGEALIASLQHPIKDVRQTAAFLMSKSENLDQKIVPQLVVALEDDDYSTRYRIIEMLGKIGDKQAVPKLLDILFKDNNRAIHKAVTDALGQIGDPRAVPALIWIVEAIGDEDDSACQEITDALQAIGTPEAIAFVKKWWQRRNGW
ncbi:HEAT repeat domain-containing protein [Aggregatilinea lenta]|uniref:HEAT repeat domain-containing protein n=1 Tax=Aggregatilinea lenta TaxID=913108 RepID=UPI000E5A1E51|nr:HEAT repeat domain-containing protein [Aggregatilinea lenta]